MTGSLLLRGAINMVDTVDEKADAVLTQGCHTFIVPSVDLKELEEEWQTDHPQVHSVTDMEGLMERTLEGAFGSSTSYGKA